MVRVIFGIVVAAMLGATWCWLVVSNHPQVFGVRPDNIGALATTDRADGYAVVVTCDGGRVTHVSMATLVTAEPGHEATVLLDVEAAVRDKLQRYGLRHVTVNALVLGNGRFVVQGDATND